MSIIRIAAICLGLLIATGVQADVKVYDVDFKYQREVYAALSNILVDNPAHAAAGGAYGRVQLLPNGQIVVDTAPETHREIEQLLAAVKARQADVPPSARFRYWVVLGTSAADAGGGDTPSALSDVLDELERVHGDLTFQLLGTATLVTESGQQGAVEGRPLTVTQRAYVQGETASAEIEMRWLMTERIVTGSRQTERGQPFDIVSVDETRQNLSLNVSLERGEFLVLGENTLRTSGGLDGILFYIVHWPAGE